MAVKFHDALMHILQHIYIYIYIYCCSSAVAGATFYCIDRYYFSCA